MKKILLITNSSSGLYKFRKELIDELLRKEFKVFLALPSGDKIDLLKQLGCIIVDMPVERRGTNPFKDLKLIFQYIKLIKQVKPNVVLTYTIKPNIYGSIACRFLKVPYITNITGLGSALLQGGMLTEILFIMYKIAIKKSRMVFFQNQINMKYMIDKSVGGKNHKLIPGSGVNLENFSLTPYPDENSPIVFNFIGRVMKDKGIIEYLNAAEIIKAKYPEAEFNVIGYIEPDEADYEYVIAEYEKRGLVKYWGYQSNIQQFIKESHCIIQPSYHEGMSNVLLESAAMGRVLIGSDIPGCREIIEDEVNGFTFKVGDVQDLVGKIEKFIKLPYDAKAELGKNSRRKVEIEFDRKIVVESYMEEINKIL